MKVIRVVVAAGVLLSMSATAEAGRRITCQCSGGKTKTWIHHNFACEYDLKKPFSRSGVGRSKPVKFCSADEYYQFHNRLCRMDGCSSAVK
jgi:hypothetical protein